MNGKSAPSAGRTAHRWSARGMAPGRPRWQQRLYRAVVPVLLAGLLMPVVPAGPAVGASLPGIEAAPMPAPVTQGVAFEELGADAFTQPIYARVKAEWDKQFKPTTGISIPITAANYSASGGLEGLQVVENFEGRPGPALLWTVDDGWVEWTVDIPQTGFYEITVEYYPIRGKRASIQRDLLIDGELPFREAKRIVFHRVWREAFWPPKKDNRGNDIRPAQVEVPQWQKRTIQDADGRYDAPFQFALTQGQHTIRLNTVRETIALGTITIHSPVVIPTYQEKLAEWRAKGYREVTGDIKVKVEAEVIYLKSDPTIRGEVNFDALASPNANGLFTLNSFGWGRWRLPGQWASWKITVPEDGLYQISLDIWQGWATKRPALRTIRIDGEIPFREMQAVAFRNSRDWRLETLRPNQERHEEPYLFYLTKGEHILQMEVALGFMGETIRALDTILVEMSALSRQMLMITGAQPDPNMEWDLHEKIPDLVPRLQAIADEIGKQARRMDQEARSKTNVSSALNVVQDQLQRMISKPREIHRLLDDFNRSQSTVGAQLLNMQYHYLAVEWLMVHSKDATLPRVKANIFEQTIASLKTFIQSFFRDYTGIGSTYGKGEQVLEVWVGRGTEWGQIMKDMIEETFTPQTGIKVNIHVIPPAALGEGQGSVLLLATTAGEAPDVAVGVPAHLPVDFAVRKGLVNLSDFPDYPQVAARFRPGALIPFRYQVPGTQREGNWAVPETQNFAMTFYRTDVLQELNIKPPDTWDDVYDALLKLQQNGLDFHYPPPTGVAVAEGSVGFTPFLFQNGGDYYTCNSEGVCKSALGTPQALQGFIEWTDLYSNYKIPREANFFTRMRTGEQPLGVAGYLVYQSLSVAAPELTGRWEMRPMPGHRRPDGTIDRTSGGTGEAIVIFEQSKQKNASWEFVKWWTDHEQQERYGAELEALIGVEARWNTANLQALQALPWPKKDIASILEQWRWFKEPPVVLGGYFTGRHVLNAWNRVVLQGVNPRESLEDAVYDINKELAKKQEEFGLKPDPSMYRRGG